MSDKTVSLHESHEKPITQYRGYDSFYFDPGKFKSFDCKICGAKMDVRRNLFGPTSFVAAMTKSKRRHDHFSCPHSGAEWHDKAYSLLAESEKTASESVRALILGDLKKVLEEYAPKA